MFNIDQTSNINPILLMTSEMHFHTLFYDETNNFRKLLLSKESKTLNTQKGSHANELFYLGGIALPLGFNKNTFLQMAFENFKSTVNKNKKELKFEDVAKNDLPSILKSKHLKRFLEILDFHGVCIHYSIVDVLYLTITELVDQPEIANKFYELYPKYKSEINQIGNTGSFFKDMLYQLFKSNKHDFMNLITLSNFPHIQDSKSFIQSFIDLLQRIKKTSNPKNIDMAIRVYSSIKDKEVVFMHNDDYSNEKIIPFLADFTGIYLDRITTLTSSNHIFDTELSVQNDVLKYLKDNNLKTHVEFKNSETDFRIQMADIFIGFFRKFTDYHLSTPIEVIKENFDEMNDFQKECIRLLYKIEQKSEFKCIYFIRRALSETDRNKIFEADFFYMLKLGLIQPRTSF